MGDYLSALSVLGQWQYWVALCAGVFLVGTIGLIPGVGITTVAAVALPFLLFNIHEPLIALTFLAAVGGVANTLDSVPAILLGYPSAATQVTFLEGHQLAMQGRAAHTLGCGLCRLGSGWDRRGRLLVDRHALHKADPHPDFLS